MGIGLVGKIPGTRLISGSVWYGERTKEAMNRKYRLFPKKAGSRSIMIVGKKAITYIDAPKKKTRKKVSV